MVATMGFVAFSLYQVITGLSARNETASAFNRDIFSDRHQLMLYGLALLFIFVPVELGFPRFLGLTRLSGNQWLLCVIFAFLLLLVDEVIKVFMRRRRSKRAPSVAVPAPAQA